MSSQNRVTAGTARLESGSVVAEESVSRAERKERTRQSLLDAALYLTRDRSLSSLSLREITRQAHVVPTAFYRHFDSVEHLGIALVEETMRTLRRVLRDARRATAPDQDSDLISDSISVLAEQVQVYGPYFRFLVNERFGGMSAVRRAIESELRLVVSDLTTDLARMPVLRDWTIDDLEMAADLMVNAMLAVVPALLDGAARRDRADLLVRAENQLRLIALGMGVAGRSDVVRRTEVTGSVVAQTGPVTPAAGARPPRQSARRAAGPSR